MFSDINNVTNIELRNYIKSTGHTIKSYSKVTGIPLEILKEKLKEVTLPTDNFIFYGYEVQDDKAIEMFQILDEILFLCELYY